MGSSPSRFLMVRLSALGDIVHALPVLYALRDSFPQAHIGWLVEDRHAAVVQNLSVLDRVHMVPRRAWQREGHRLRGVLALRRQLRAEEYEVVLDLQGLTKSGLWSWLAGAPVRIGFAGEESREANAWFMTRRVAPPPRARHVIDRNLALAAAAGACTDRVRMDIPCDGVADHAVALWWTRTGLGAHVVAISPGAGWRTKQWPPQFYARLADRIIREAGAQVLVLWGPGEQELAGEIWRAAQEDLIVAPTTSVQELIEALRRCAALVAGDTGPLHLAAALGVPCLALFGASDPLRNGPYGTGHLVVTREIHCRPCWRTRCPTAIECLTDLSPEMVWERVAQAGFFARLRTDGVPSPVCKTAGNGVSGSEQPENRA